MTALVTWLLENRVNQSCALVIVTVVLISTVALLASQFVRRSPAVRHWVLLSALLCIIGCPLLVGLFHSQGWSTIQFPAAGDAPTSGFPVVSDRDQRAAPAPATEAANGPLAPAEVLVAEPKLVTNQILSGPPTVATPTADHAPREVPPPREQANIVFGSSAPAVPDRPAARSPDHSMHTLAFWSFILWGIGACALGTVFLRDCIRLRRLCRTLQPSSGVDEALSRIRQRLGIQQLPSVASSDLTSIPFVTGFFRPVIVLPAGLQSKINQDQLEDVLAHEVAHALRGDQLVVWLQAIARCLYWPLPPVHLLNRALASAREEVCDNYVLARRDAVSYGETLLHVAELSRGAAPLPAAMGVLHWRGKLEDRVARMVDETRATTIRPMWPTTAITLALFACASVLVGGVSIVTANSRAPQQEAADSTTVDTSQPESAATEAQDTTIVDSLVLGVVETPDGKPASGARVWLVGGDYGAPVTLGETVADESGNFAFTDLPDEQTVFANPSRLCVWARQGDDGIGWFDDLRQYKRRKPLKVRLRATADFHVRLVGADGQPIAGAVVTPQFLSGRKLNVGGASYGQPTAEVLPGLPFTTDSNGEFVIRALPEFGSLTAQIAARGYGEPRLTWNLGQSITTRLEPAGGLSGRIVWPAAVDPSTANGGKNLGEVSLFGQADYKADGSRTSDRTDASYTVRYSQSLPINGDGVIRCDAAPPGDYSASVRFSPDVPALPGEQLSFALKPGEVVADLMFLTAPAISINGRVIGAADKKPVEGATVKLWHIGEGRMSHGSTVTTDRDGKYLVHTAQGKLRIGVIKAPAGYTPLTSGGMPSEFAKLRVPTREVQQHTTWPDLELDPAGDLELVVTDEDGKPVEGAVVKVVTPVGRDRQSWDLGQTDARGRYVLRGVDLRDTLPICVRTPTAISQPDLVVTPGDLDGPLRIEVSPKHGFRFRCKVVDPQGQPVANAKITISTSYRYVSKWNDGGSGLALSGSAGSFTTDDRGVVETGPLWPDRGYRVQATAEGYAKAEAPPSRGDRGQVVDLPLFVLPRSQPPVTGVVLNAAGAPLPGVRVFAAGKKWNMATDTTNARGEFRLEDVAPDVRYVLADAAGYRLGGGTVSRDQASVTISLRSNDSPPRGVAEPSHPALALQHAIATPPLLNAWGLIKHPRTTARIAPLEAMVRINPDTAAAISKAGGGYYDYVVRVELAKQVVDEDPKRALQLLRATPNWSGLNTAISLSKRLAKSDQADDRRRAIEFAELAAELADQQNPPSRYPKVARLFTHLEQHERARALIDRVMESLEGETASQSKRLAIDTAVALAPYDFERAIKMAQLAEEGYQRTQAVADVALAILPTDPDKAVETIEAIRGGANAPTIRDRSRLRMAIDLVDDDLDLAIELVQRCEEPDNRAQALGHLAVDVSRYDQRRAWRLIDEALVTHRSAEGVYQRWLNYGQGGPFAALLAYQAKQTGYPDMESVIWHVRSSCRAKADATSGQNRLKTTIGTARILALVDQQAARDLLELVSDQESQIPRGEGSSLYDQWLQAWLLVDFERGIELVNSDLNRVAQSEEEDAFRYWPGAVFRLLAAAPDERLPLVADSYSGLWQLYED